jgi:hypothetical protein
MRSVEQCWHLKAERDGDLYTSRERCWEEVGTPSFIPASLFDGLVLPMLPPIAPSLGTPIFGIITIPISI